MIPLYVIICQKCPQLLFISKMVCLPKFKCEMSQISKDNQLGNGKFHLWGGAGAASASQSYFSSYVHIFYSV